MDPNVLLECFGGTLNHDSSVRTQAESQLQQASTTPGFLGACLDIISAASISESIKLSAALYFKNKISYGWSGKKLGRNELLDYTVDNDEKPVVKDMLVKALVQCSIYSPNCIRLLQPALTVIVSEEFPHKRWDSLLSQSFELLASNDIDSSHIGLLCLAEIFRTYRWKENDERQDLEILIVDYFPSLLEFASTLFNDGKNMDNDKIGDMIKLILKIYKFVTYHDLPFTLQRTESFIAWANFHVSIVQQPLSQKFLLSTTKDNRKNHSWVKAKKWAYGNLCRLFQRYASDSLSRKFNYDEFKSLYVEQFLPQLLQLFFQQIEGWGNGELWLSDEAIHHILSFIEQTIIQKPTWPLVKPHYPTILAHVIFPLLCPTEETLESFEIDPQEYIHRNLELWDDDYSPDFAALSLLTTTVSKRGKTTLQPTLQFVHQKFSDLASSFNSLTLQQAVEIESCLRIISSILDRLSQKASPYAGELENFLCAYVFPFFESNYVFLRARVCEICSKLGDIEFKKDTTLPTIYNGVMTCFNESSSCLPVELLAALALQTFIQVPQFHEPISANVVPTMQKLLQISNEIESDAISGVMQEFVESFAEQLQPFGVELMNNLVQQFLKLAIELHDASNVDINNMGENFDVSDENDKQMAALGVLSTAISILLSFENSLDIVKSLEHSFYPAAEFILKNDMEDFFREVCEFVENSTFLLRNITPISWKILELMGICNRKEDTMVSFYIEDFMLALNNYLVYGKDELRKNQFYSNIIFEIYHKAAVREDNAFDDMVVIFELSQKMVLALGDKCPKGFVERFLQDALNSIVAEKDSLKKHIVFGVSAFNVVMACLVCFPMVTLQYLEIQHAAELIFETWFGFYIPNYKRVYDIKLSVMAVLSILSQVSVQDLSMLSLQNLLPQSGSKLTMLMSLFPQALRHLEEKRKEYTSDVLNTDQFDNFGTWDDEGEDEEPIDEEQAYLEFLKDEANNLRIVNGEAGAFGEFEDFDDLEEDPLSGSVLDDINIYDVFKTVVGGLQNDHEKYGIFASGLSAEDQNTLAQLVNL